MLGKRLFLCSPSRMVLPVADLSDDVDTLKAMILGWRERAAKEAQIEAATAEVARLKALQKSATSELPTSRRS
ncbi:hypothetical protein ACVDG5_034940 [Mesorhizobium sp. ORM6]